MELPDVTLAIQLLADLCVGGLAYKAVKELQKIVDVLTKKLDNHERRLEELEK